MKTFGEDVDGAERAVTFLGVDLRQEPLPVLPLLWRQRIPPLLVSDHLGNDAVDNLLNVVSLPIKMRKVVGSVAAT